MIILQLKLLQQFYADEIGLRATILKPTSFQQKQQDFLFEKYEKVSTLLSKLL